MSHSDMAFEEALKQDQRDEAREAQEIMDENDPMSLHIPMANKYGENMANFFKQITARKV